MGPQAVSGVPQGLDAMLLPEIAKAAGKRVIWSIESGAGMNPLMRWFGLLAQPRVAQDFDLGLEGLARAAGG